jgi:hypothetical protein
MGLYDSQYTGGQNFSLGFGVQPQYGLSPQDQQFLNNIKQGNFNLGFNQNTGAAPTQQETNMMQLLFGGQNQMGVIPAGLGTASALLNAYVGLEQLGVAQDSLNFQKDAFNKNYTMQAQLTNKQIYDQAYRRHAENPNQFEAPDKVVDKYGAKV